MMITQHTIITTSMTTAPMMMFATLNKAVVAATELIASGLVVVGAEAFKGDAVVDVTLAFVEDVVTVAISVVGPVAVVVA